MHVPARKNVKSAFERLAGGIILLAHCAHCFQLVRIQGAPRHHQHRALHAYARIYTQTLGAWGVAGELGKLSCSRCTMPSRRSGFAPLRMSADDADVFPDFVPSQLHRVREAAFRTIAPRLVRTPPLGTTHLLSLPFTSFL